MIKTIPEDRAGAGARLRPPPSWSPLMYVRPAWAPFMRAPAWPAAPADPRPGARRSAIRTGRWRNPLRGCAPSGAGPAGPFLFFHGNADRVTSYAFLADGLALHTASVFLAGLLSRLHRLHRFAHGGLACSSTAWPPMTGWPMSRRGPSSRLASRSAAAWPCIWRANDRNSTASSWSLPSIPSSSWRRRIIFSCRSGRFSTTLSAPIHGSARCISQSCSCMVNATRLSRFRHGRALFEQAPEPKRLRIFEDRGHNDIWTDALMDDVVAFATSLQASQ